MVSDMVSARPRESCEIEEIGQPVNGPAVSFKRLRICAWIDTSSAETGSSATMSFGSSAGARGRDQYVRCPAGELVRVELGGARRQPDLSDISCTRSTREARFPIPGRQAAREATHRPAYAGRASVRILEHHLQIAASLASFSARKASDVGVTEG